SAHRIAPTAQARQQVFELGELDLSLALAALGVLAEDIEDDGRPVDDLDLHDVFERAPLARSELGIGDHCVCAGCGDEILELLRFASTEVGGRIWVRTTLQHPVEHDSTCGL